tara:strand:+ start:619 stop:1581 length:963 start_codon:yes stop_codon:yes gene_type:complete
VINGETIALADSIDAGDHTLETLEALMECKDLASLTVGMTPSNVSLGNILTHVTGESNMDMRLQLLFLCGVRRIWKQHVVDGSREIPYRLLEIAGFGGFVLEPSALEKVMPLPRGNVYDFLMRVRGADSQQGELWFQYIISMREYMPSSAIHDIGRAILDHPDVLVTECIVKACIDTNMPVEVFSGGMVRRVLLKCTIPSRRRLRCGSRTESSRSAVLATWISSWMDSAHVAVLIRDIIFNEILMHSDVENMDFELLGGIVSKMQSRLPYIPMCEEDISRIPVKVREWSKTWCGIVECIRRRPPSEERVDHPVWAVRRHY